MREWLTMQWLRLKTLFRRRQLERDLEDELAFHFSQRGDTPETYKRFGNRTQWKEQTRELWTFPAVETFVQDVRYGARQLVRYRGWSIVVILSLALGIGANTAIFSVVDAVMLRSLPVADPDSLVLFGTRSDGVEQSAYFSESTFRQMRGAIHGVSGMFVASRVGEWVVSYGRDQDPLSRDSVMGAVVSGEYFSTLGLNPQVGRLLGPEDDRVPEGHPVVVISDDLWRQRFERDPNIVNEILRLNGALFTIVGVAPRGFHGVAVGSKPYFWASVQMDRTLRAPPLRMFARLDSGVSMAQVRGSIAPIFQQEIERRAARVPSEQLRRRLLSQELAVLPGGQGAESLRRQFSEPLMVLLGIVALVLLIACANVANLLLARSVERSREISLRSSLGAGRGRLIRQLLTESLLLASLGGAAGLALAYPAGRLLVSLASNDVWQLGTGIDPAAIDVSPDGRVLLFTLAASTLAGVLFGLAPAVGATRADLSSSLKKQPRSVGAGFWGVGWGRVLVVGQTALSVVLLVAAVLFVQTLVNLYSLDAGYDRHNVLVAKIDLRGIGLEFERRPGQTRYPEAEAKIHAFYHKILDGLRSVAGVESASISFTAVANSVRMLNFGLKTAGYTPAEGEGQVIHSDAVSPGYFRTVGMDLILGRDFTDGDSGDAPPVVILNDLAAKKNFGAENPVGRQVWLNPEEPMQVVGMVKSARYIDLREELFPLMYRPALQGGWLVNFALMRTRGAPETMAPTIRRHLAAVVPELKVTNITTLQRNVEDRTVNERLVAHLSAAFGALALVLAAIGLYGVLGSAVSRRTQEFGVRAAFGAHWTNLAGMILREGFALVAVGVLVGAMAALAGGRLVEGLLFDLRADDPTAFATAALLMLLAAALACLRPMIRVASVEPMDALRHE